MKEAIIGAITTSPARAEAKRIKAASFLLVEYDDDLI